jgi:hypothetical protein
LLVWFFLSRELFKTKLLNYDEYYLGLNNSMYLVNEPNLNYKIGKLKQLSSIEQYVQTFGKIEHDQNLLRIEILNQYL